VVVMVGGDVAAVRGGMLLHLFLVDYGGGYCVFIYFRFRHLAVTLG